MSKTLLYTAILSFVGFFSSAQSTGFFTGAYRLSSSSSALTGQPVFDEGFVEVIELSNSRFRYIQLQPYPGFAQSGIVLTLDLIDNEIRIPLTDTGVQCGGNPSVLLGPAQNGTNPYNESDGDESFEIVILEDANSSCIAQPQPVTLTFTAVPDDVTVVVDDAFEQHLIDIGLDDVLDDYVLTTNIETVTSLEMVEKGITDLTGIKAFTALELLDVNSNAISQLDLQENAALTTLIAANNNIGDNFTLPNSLQLLELQNNGTTQSDYSQYVNLTTLIISDNAISANPVFPSNLEVLDVSRNGFTALDVSSTTSLTDLKADGNLNLLEIDLRNNNNASLSNFSAVDNVSLACVSVSDVDYMTTTFPSALDEGVNYTFSCTNTNLTFVPDDNFEQALIDLGLDDTLDNYISTETAQGVTILNLNQKGISNLRGLESFTSLDSLYISNNPLDRLDVSDKPNLKLLFASGSSLSSIDLTNNTGLLKLNLDFNTISQIDLSANSNLELFRIQANRITSLDLSGAVALKQILAGGNSSLASLDVSQNPNLEYFDVLFCPNVTSVDFTNNPELNYFRAGYGQNGDPSTGIQSLDFSNNPKMKQIIFTGSGITSFDPTNLLELETLWMDNARLSAIDVTQNQLLTYLNVSRNSISELDISQNTELLEFYAASNLMTQVDVSNNDKLTNLDVSRNAISELLVDNLTQLFFIGAASNNLTTMDLSNNPKLEIVYLDRNQLVSLNIANGANELLRLNDPNDPNPDLFRFTAIENPDLTCVTVSDLAYMNNNFPNNVGAASYSLDCDDIGSTPLSDDGLEQLLVELGLDDSVDGEIDSSTANNLKSLVLSNGNLGTFNDLGKFPALENLEASGNMITTIDLSGNPNLIEVDLSDNNLTTIDLTNNQELQTLNLQNNALTGLTLKSATGELKTSFSATALEALKELYVDNNPISELDITANTNLEVVSAPNTMLTALDVSSNGKLKDLLVSNNQITELNLENNALLETIKVSSNNLTDLTTSNLSNLDVLEADSNQIVSLDLSANSNLRKIIVNDNALTSLNLDNGANELLLPNNPQEPANEDLWYFNAKNNSGLSCAKVSNVDYMRNNFGSNIDATTSFNATCGTASIDSTDLIISFYPNPVNNQLYINSSVGIIQKVRIYDIAARVLKTVPSNDSSVTLNLGDLATGNYFMEIHTDQGVSKKQFVKK
ncbi:hypothetical protein AAU57_08240 [Nonlabens sp. YIK11]|uniref:T9SS type A sorting domain-containing protein n=1 Tax=Nonlabens sp. YIK11 TaxID=1453349 RepID=UPI0006DC4AB1|nr:T9SS type A sorting domain-containing protein [Nonlabens sp. YIK11]KQC33308.1 hypothetical protein AAU57_08240 [Nonlabens sp. YIK11]